jgi:hypothetical protein
MRRRALVVVCFLISALLVPISQAAADKPERGCPPPFEMKTNAEAVELLDTEFHPDASHEDNVAFIALIDLNEDGLVCLQVREDRHFPDNWVDNTSNH